MARPGRKPRKKPVPLEFRDNAEDVAKIESGEETVHEVEVRRRAAERKPFGGVEQRLSYPKRPGYHRHWFNDRPGRIARAKEAGYDHVLDHNKRPVSRPVGTQEGGGPEVAFLMEIREDWWQQDKAAKQKQVDEIDAQIRRGEVGTQEPDSRYQVQRGPKPAIQIEEGVGE